MYPTSFLPLFSPAEVPHSGNLVSLEMASFGREELAFEAAASVSRELRNVSTGAQLELYGLFKHVRQGECTRTQRRPALFFSFKSKKTDLDHIFFFAKNTR